MKWVYRIMIGLSATILICGLSVLTTGLVVNAYVQSLLSSMNIKWEGQPAGLSSVLKLGWSGTSSDETNSNSDSETESKTALSTVNGDETGETDETGGLNGIADSSQQSFSSSDGGESSPDANQTNGAGEGGQTEDGGQASSAPDNALPVMGGSISGDSGGGSGSEDPVITPDQLTAKKDDIPADEKEEVFSILMNKLPGDEMQKITADMEGGLTEGELMEIQQIMSKYLDKDDYAKIMNILK